MANRAPPFLADRETPSIARRHGMEQQLEEGTEGILAHILCTIPGPPVSADAHLCILLDSDGGGVDRVSLLPDALLRDIVSRLPIKDAARTAALSRRWRPIWLSTPLVLDDTHLLPAGRDEIPRHVKVAQSSAVAAAVSHILATHPGPFRCIRLACCHMDEDHGRVARWLQLLAVKGVQELFLINRRLSPFTITTHMPATFFSIATLTRLYLGFWRFPDTADLPRGAAFPHLRELGLCSVVIESRDMDFILARSPVLEILFLQGHMCPPLHLRLVSHSLRCVQIHWSHVETIAVVDAPCLERLILSGDWRKKGKGTRIKLVHAPVLRLFGYFEPEKHALHIGNTTIKAGTLMNASAIYMVPATKILALQVRFGVRNDAKMLPSFFRCFPNVERLHIYSKKTDEPTGKLNLKFWQEAGAIECVRSHINQLILHDFRGEKNELAFLKFFIESAQMLKNLVIVCAKGCFNSKAEVNSKLQTLFAGKKASKCCLPLVYESAFPEGGFPWNLQRASDFSRDDPFGFLALV
ncbi:hypothetical protein SEVIR_7G026700v4 [Setaria viridis]|uniref:F-box domain-containing protein n=1 Tax=Setaria viridis TaxID=4556 RepID=A0A4U6TNL3_SETVI|nr:F-box/LRR-repeat protein 13-like [Setaria viridis]TKW03472.1 hypothetical protein SEVIR_7G026700v2 [Setaria viridis]